MSSLVTGIVGTMLDPTLCPDLDLTDLLGSVAAYILQLHSQSQDDVDVVRTQV